MTLKKLIVKGLFNTFDYDINFDKKDITIIIGENGVGKTTLLRILDAVLSNKITYLFSIEFNSIELHFSSTTWTISKPDDKSMVIKDLAIKSSYRIPKDDREEQIKLLHNLYTSKSLEEKENFKDTLSNYLLQESLGKIFYHPYELKKNTPSWYEGIIRKNHVIFIRTQRLYRSTYKGEDKSKSLDYMVDIYSKELVKILQRNNADFTAESMKLDSTFAQRLIAERRKKNKVSIQDIGDEIHNLNTYKGLLSKVGIIDKQNDDFIKGSWDDDSLSILNLYVKDNRKKLDVFKDTAIKLDLLCEIINKRFKYKNLYIDKNEGFRIIAEKDGRKIELTDLSSGEQNELIIFYHLLFKTKEGDLVLIDEPEISLHIVWQQQLIGDMSEIADKTGIKLVIATHSPDIIGDNWSMVQILGER